MKTKKEDAVALWAPTAATTVPTDARSPRDIAKYAAALSPQEVVQLVKAFRGGSFDMASSFVWQRSMAQLKKNVGALGMDFVAEMLDRKDISATANPMHVLTDHDALRLAEELGFFSATHMLRLRTAMAMIHHFSSPFEDGATEGMTRDEATQTLRTCVQTILGRVEGTTALKFSEFRRSLESQNLRAEDAEIAALVASPYFFQRTTVRVLTSLAKTRTGAALEHVLANLNTVLPKLWPGLLAPDRYGVGWCYSELHADGKQGAAAAIRAALLKVRGFDYVPESLRSRTYLDAAQRVVDAHFGMNNFYNEAAPLSALEALGSSFPVPALAQCMRATLLVFVGNQYGVAFAAQDAARRLLDNITPDRWTFYLNGCLAGDDAVLGELMSDRPAKRFGELATERQLLGIHPTNPDVAELIRAAANGRTAKTVGIASGLYQKCRGG